MSTAPQKLMTVDEFLGWAEGREGRWELYDGRPIATDNSKGIGFPSEASGAIVSSMSTAAEKLMTVDEFLGWAEGREGRWELYDGRPNAMSPERAAHAETKAEAWAALRHAVERAGAPCRAMPDGMTVRISARTAFDPDALVYCGERLPPGAIEVPSSLSDLGLEVSCVSTLAAQVQRAATRIGGSDGQMQLMRASIGGKRL